MTKTMTVASHESMIYGLAVRRVGVDLQVVCKSFVTTAVVEGVVTLVAHLSRVLLVQAEAT